MTTSQRIADGYAASTAPEDAHGRRVAGAFTYDQAMEDIAALADADPAKYDQLPPVVRMRLGFYLSSKVAAETYGVDTTPKETS